MKYYIKELYCEDTSMYWETIKDDILNNHDNSIFIGGNRRFYGCNNELLNVIYDKIIDYISDYDVRVYYKNNIANYIIDTLKPYKKISLKQALKIISGKYGDKYFDIDDVLSIIYCKPYKKYVMCGNSQGDYQYIYYDAILEDYIKYIEAVYFGMGIEIEIHDGANIPSSVDEIEGYTEYIPYYNDPKAKIADMLGCSIDDIIYYAIEDIKYRQVIDIKYGEGR